MHWTGQLTRVEDDRVPKKSFHGELVQGNQLSVTPPKCFKDVVKCKLKTPGVNVEYWENHWK